MLKLAVLTVAGVVIVIGALYTAIWGPRARARRRLQRGTTVISDRTIVTVTGIVRARGELLVAPLSGKVCVLYAAHGRVRTGNSNELGIDEVIAIAAHKMIPFELETRDGVITIEGDSADLELPPYPLIPRSIERECAFLESHGHARQLAVSSTFEEVTIEPDARVSVQGMALLEADPSGAGERGYRESAPRVRLIGHANHPLTIGRAR